MNAPGRPHVRIWRGDVYIERVPNAWVLVCNSEDYEHIDEPARIYLIDKALKKGLDFELPRGSVKGSDEIPR